MNRRFPVDLYDIDFDDATSIGFLLNPEIDISELMEEFGYDVQEEHDGAPVLYRFYASRNSQILRKTFSECDLEEWVGDLFTGATIIRSHGLYMAEPEPDSFVIERMAIGSYAAKDFEVDKDQTLGRFGLLLHALGQIAGIVSLTTYEPDQAPEVSYILIETHIGQEWEKDKSKATEAATKQKEAVQKINKKIRW